MSGGLVTAAYIVAAILFIFSLAGLSKHETSRQGNNFGIAGMAIALIATIFGPDTGNVGWILLAMVIGGAIGIRLAKKVEMTEMPELVAILHSFVGLAAVLVGFNSYLHHDAGMAPILVNIHLTEVFLGIFIGAVTFTGSVVAFGKLCGKISSKPLMLPNRHKMNLAALIVSFLLLIVFVRTDSVGLQVLALLIMTAIALVFGWHLVASIGGADMPVVVLMGTFSVLYAFGYSVNTLTMFAMVLAIGLLVDDAIVVVENVERIMSEEGLTPREATRKSMGQIQGALVGIAMVLSAVFVPMAFFGGTTGAIYRQFSITIVAAIVGISVARKFCRNRYITRKTRAIASRSVFTTSSMEALTNEVVSYATLYSSPCGKYCASSSRRLSTSSAVAISFAPEASLTPSPEAGLPLKRLR